MLRRLLLLIAVVGILLALVPILLAVAFRPGGGPIYSVAAVDRGLQQHPRAWLGHTIRVRGRAIAVARDAAFFQLKDLRADDSWLVWAVQDDRLRVVLRGLPLVRRLVPAPQRAHFGTPAVYTVRIGDPQSSCTVASCAIFVLPDAAPPQSRQRLPVTPPLGDPTLTAPLSH